MLAVLSLGLFAARGCTPAQEQARTPRYVMMVGVDVSGSFRGSGHYEDALDFLAHYLYGHLHGLGELREPTALFVGPVGGDTPGEVQPFHPIHDFRGKSVEQISADLREWFPPENRDRLTDFGAFFRRISELAKQRGLVLAPMNIVLLSDGVPDLAIGPGRGTAGGVGGSAGGSGRGSAVRATPTGAGAGSSAAATARAAPPESLYATVDVSPLEYLSRSITVRLLYPDATVAAGWERGVKRRRVRLWTTDETVMQGWREQLEEDLPPEQQTALWTWVRDNVDFRVRQRIF
jgi:hypothetical protein